MYGVSYVMMVTCHIDFGYVGFHMCGGHTLLHYLTDICDYTISVVHVATVDLRVHKVSKMHYTALVMVLY